MITYTKQNIAQASAQLTEKDNTQPKGGKKVSYPRKLPKSTLNKIMVRPVYSSLPALQRFVLRFNFKEARKGYSVDVVFAKR